MRETVPCWMGAFVRGLLRSANLAVGSALCLVLVTAACAAGLDRSSSRAQEQVPGPVAGHAGMSPEVPYDAAAAAAPLPAMPPTPPASAAAAGSAHTKLRVFVASESTEQVWVLEGADQLAVVAKIPVGKLPHQMGVSPDGKWVAVNNRMSNSASIIDTSTLKEVARVMVGKQPHGIAWTVDSKTLFIAHERDMYIQPIEAGTWRPLPPLMVGVPQHVLTIGSQRPNELYYSLTNTAQGNVLRMWDLATGKVTQIPVGDVHDVYYTPDQGEIWSSSSGFLDKPSDRIVVYDPGTHTVKGEFRLTGHYPFHTLKEQQDGPFFPKDRSYMVLSDHLLPGLLWIDFKTKKVTDQTKLGQQPFHSTYDAIRDRMLVTTNVDGMVNVIDAKTHQVIQKIAVPKAHGIGSVGIP